MYKETHFTLNPVLWNMVLFIIDRASLQITATRCLPTEWHSSVVTRDPIRGKGDFPFANCFQIALKIRTHSVTVVNL